MVGFANIIYGGIKTTLQFIETSLKPLLLALLALYNVQTRI